MDALTNAYIKMMTDVEKLYDANQAILDNIPAFAAKMVVFKNHNATIGLLLPLAEETTKPTTNERDLILENMCLAAEKVCKPVQAYAASINDLLLEGSMNWTADSLGRQVKDVVGPTCVSIHTKATEVKTPAADFGLKQSDLDDLDTNNTAWAAKQSAIRAKQVASSQAKRQILKSVADNKNLLNRILDRMVATLSDSNPTLVGLWNQTRQVMDPGTTVTTQRFKVVHRLEDSNMEPLYQATVVMEKQGVRLELKTNSLGEVEFRPIKQGIYRVTVSLAGYQTVTFLEFRVKQGKIGKQEVELLPNEA
ncbi:MAG: hypothetical protein GC192_01335 [Bacteroidetes bacterium]|nr:hypothetical protein [Bacteroidota bacterium]